MMKSKLLVSVLGILVLLVLIGLYFTSESEYSSSSRWHLGKREPSTAPTVDQSLLEAARSLLPIASTQEEDQLAREAIRQADHEVDLAFTMALRRAKLQPAVQTPEIKGINGQIQVLERQIKADQAEISRLTQLAEHAGSNKDEMQDRLELAQAQKGLHENELEDLQQDLVLAGGDPYTEIQQQLKKHEGLQHADSASPQPKPVSFEPGTSLLSQSRACLRLWGNRKLLQQARQQAEGAADELAKRYQTLSQRLKGERRSLPAAPADGQEERGAALSALHTHIDWQRVLADLAKRIAAEQQVAGLYTQWVGIVGGQLRATFHAILRSLLLVFVLFLALVLIEGAVERHLDRLGFERRRMGTMRMVLRFASRTIGVLLLLLILLGPPNQLSTIVAFAGAGLTVALKDFIVAFFGWFVLMGRNGIRVGDWVEINGIGGEVVEIGLLKTVLLETGNWNDSGHPTGRKVAFVNSFAMERHYFNFSTSGQWLWDELDVLVPPDRDPYALMDALHQLVAEETKTSVMHAEEEWQRATHSHSVQSFSAAPAISIRPTNLGISVVVRYITCANERHALRTRLYKAIVELMLKPPALASGGQAVNAPSS